MRLSDELLLPVERYRQIIETFSSRIVWTHKSALTKGLIAGLLPKLEAAVPDFLSRAIGPKWCLAVTASFAAV